MVVNAPTSNIVSAAELAVALMLAAARNIAPAHAALKNGEWKRSKYSGIELYEKTVGIVGLGRIGVLVAQRLSAFGMSVIAYDPYVQAGRAAQMGVRLVDLDTLLAESDFMSVHLPKTPETSGLIGADQLAKAKSSLVLVNAARGGIVDEAALFDALKTGRIAAAGLDVFAKEPCTDSPLFELENVVATPHLGASTDEAQEKAGIAVARSVRLALAGELVPDAVNVQGGVIAEDVRPGIPLTEKLGQIFTGVAGEVAQQLDVEVRGEITEHDVKVLELAALKGVFSSVVEDQVSYVNAPLLAAERGTAVRLVTDPESPDHRNLITIRGTLADGSQVSVSGTLVGIHQKERIVEVNGYDIDIEPTDHLALLTYDDRPGMVGTVGQILGDAQINIAGMQVSRDTKGGQALVALSVDSAIPADTLSEIASAISATSIRAVDLVCRSVFRGSSLALLAPQPPDALVGAPRTSTAGRRWCGAPRTSTAGRRWWWCSSHLNRRTPLVEVRAPSSKRHSGDEDAGTAVSGRLG